MMDWLGGARILAISLMRHPGFSARLHASHAARNCPCRKEAQFRIARTCGRGRVPLMISSVSISICTRNPAYLA